MVKCNMLILLNCNFATIRRLDWIIKYR
uniref:Uncharacterized protein n=1 Tax=Anguilla anguilla TaxID=7936 RepID=A0A0E9UF68_ANGAN